MLWLIIKYLSTAAVVVAISEVAKRSDKLGGLIAALPLVTILSLIWLQSGKTRKPENRQSCLVYILVCATYFADVFVVSQLAGQNRILANLAQLRRTQYCTLCWLCHGGKALWHRLTIKQRRTSVRRCFIHY